MDQMLYESKYVLLVEDNEDDERLTLRALRKNNVMNEVVVVCDGEKALEYIHRKGDYSSRPESEIPDLVILDLKIPKVSGLDVLKQLRKSEEMRRVPVVVMTSSEDPLEVRACFEAGANSFVIKPLDPSEFSDMVLQVAMYWLLLNKSVKP